MNYSDKNPHSFFAFSNNTTVQINIIYCTSLCVYRTDTQYTTSLKLNWAQIAAYHFQMATKRLHLKLSHYIELSLEIYSILSFLLRVIFHPWFYFTCSQNKKIFEFVFVCDTTKWIHFRKYQIIFEFSPTDFSTHTQRTANSSNNNNNASLSFDIFSCVFYLVLLLLWVQ